MKLRWLAIALILVVGAAAGVMHVRAAKWSHIDAADLVTRAHLQQTQPDYIAHVTTVTGYGGKPAESQAVVYRRGKFEKIQSSGAAWSMAMNGKSYTFLPKDRNLLVAEMSRLLTEKDRTRLLLANYKARCLGMESIAGRSSYIVDLSPRRDGRPAKRLWIDQETFTILRSEDYSASGDRSGMTETKQIDFRAKVDPKTFVLPSDVKLVMLCKSGESAEMFRNLGFAVGSPKYLPAGYRLEGYHVLNSTCGCRHHSAQLTYTDGLNVVSVFQTPKMACCKDCGMGHCKDQNCGIASMGQVERPDKTVVVVGDLLPKELNRVAESVR